MEWTEVFQFKTSRLGFSFCHPQALKLFSTVFSSRISIFSPIGWPLKSDYSSLYLNYLKLFVLSCSRFDMTIPISLSRCSGPKLFCKKGVLRNFAKFAGKHLWQGLFLIKLQKKSWYFTQCAVFVIYSGLPSFRRALAVDIQLFEQSPGKELQSICSWLK